MKKHCFPHQIIALVVPLVMTFTSWVYVAAPVGCVTHGFFRQGGFSLGSGRRTHSWIL